MKKIKGFKFLMGTVLSTVMVIGSGSSGLLATSVMASQGNQLLDGNYRVYQGSIHLSNWTFGSLKEAIAEARKWNNSRIEHDGDVIWRFGKGGVGRGSYRVYQGSIHLSNWTFGSLEGAIAEARKWNNSHIEHKERIIWTFSSGKVTRRDDRPKYIAHAGGEIRGLNFTNSKEAILDSLSKGLNYIELDFTLTSDNEYILLHDWGRANSWMDGNLKDRTHSEFMNYPMNNGLTMLDLDGLMKLMREHPDMVIVTDIKEGNEDLLKKIAWNYPELKYRIIPQVYDEKEYHLAKSLGFKDIIYSLYQVWRSDRQVLNFARENKLYAVTMGISRTKTQLPKQLRDMGVMTYCHTINSKEEARFYIDRGVQGFYTDRLY